MANTFDNTGGTVTAAGGTGGAKDGNDDAGGGGGGGDGRIRIEADSITGSTTPTASTSGLPTGGTFAAAEDAIFLHLAKNTPKRLRFEISNEGTGAANVTYRLEVSGANPAACSSASYAAVPTAATSHWQIVDSVNLTDGSATTNVTGGLTDENPTFVAGEIKDTGNETTGITLSNTEFTEIEYSVQPTSNATNGAHYCFRLTNAGSPTNFTYNQYGQATVDGADNFLVEAAGGGNIGTQVAGTPFNIQMTGRDFLGNTATSFTGTVDITSSGNLSAGGGTTASFTSGVLSSHSVTISNTGSFTITATETSSTPSGLSNAFTVDAGAPTQLAYSVEPLGASAGVAIVPAIKVQVKDSLGNLVATATDSITLAINNNPAAGTLSGTVTVAAVSGVATFGDISIDNTGSGYTLDATATGLTTATSASFDIVGSPTQLGFSVEPSTQSGNLAFVPAIRVQVQDAGGSMVPSATDSITLAINNNPSGGTLSGTLTVAAVSGEAIFSGISIDNVGDGYTLDATATGLTTATSASFDIVNADLQQAHYRWRNDDGGEGGLNTGTSADGSVTISTSQNINTNILGSLRSGNADGIVTTVASFGSATGGTTLTVASATGFAVGDEVLVINLQGDGTNNGNVGNYEFLKIASISVNTFTYSTTIQNLYGATTSNLVMTGQKVVVQRVPQWVNVTIQSGGTLTANAWDGTSGGIVAFRATGTVDVQSGGAINVDNLGYRSGAGGVADGGSNGESYDGQNGKGGNDDLPGTLGGGSGENYSTQNNTTGTRGGGGGGSTGSIGVGGAGGGGGGYGGGGGAGGGSDTANYISGAGAAGGTTGDSAGGGGHGENSGTSGDGGAAGSPGNAGGVSAAKGGGAAGSGTTTGQGGHAEDTSDSPGGGGGGGGNYGVAALTQLFFGSGGGGGGDSGAGSAGGPGLNGGAGGGIIFIIADTVDNNATIQLQGAAATTATDGDGAGGGGAGGSLMIMANTFDNTGGTVTAAGGTGGAKDSNDDAGGGGGGGVGRIRIEADSIIGSTTPTASTAGTPGTTGGATFAAAQDAVLVGAVKSTLKRLRAEISNEGTGGATVLYELEVSGANPAACSSASYSAVPTAATGHWQIVDSANITDGAPTSNIASGLTDESPTFVAGQFKDAGNQTTAIHLAASEFTEFEYSVQPTSNAADGALYCFRLVNAFAFPVVTYNQYAQGSVKTCV